MAKAKWSDVGKSSANVKIASDIVSGKITLDIGTNDNPSTYGYALSSVSAGGKSVSLSKEKESKSISFNVSAGQTKYSVSYSAINKPSKASDTKLNFLDNDGSDANAWIKISTSGFATAPSPGPSPSPSPSPGPSPSPSPSPGPSPGPAPAPEPPPPPPAPNVSISVSPSYIVNTGNQSATVSWSSSGVIDSVSSPGGGSSGSLPVSPSSSTTYSITACNSGGCGSASTFLKVYQPPNITLSLGSASIISGGSTTLYWSQSGDVSTTTIDNGIGSVPNNGSTTIAPTVSTTYSGTAVLSLGGANYTDTDSIRLIVYQPPTLQVTATDEVLYGEDITLIYEFEYANISATIVPTYRYRNANNDGFVNVTGTSVSISPISTSAEYGVTGTLVSGEITLSPVYNDDGPFEVFYNMTVVGNGGTESVQTDTNIIIDLTPDNIAIPNTDGLKDEEPVYTPDPEFFPDTELVIADVDIPVEVKADAPVKISIDGGTTWLNVREK